MVLSPLFDEYLRFSECDGPLPIKQLISQFTIELLDIPSSPREFLALVRKCLYSEIDHPKLRETHMSYQQKIQSASPSAIGVKVLRPCSVLALSPILG